jgi:hypothetical protein
MLIVSSCNSKAHHQWKSVEVSGNMGINDWFLSAQALQLVSDVHSLADQVRRKCGTKTPEGGLTPRYSLNSPSDGQV